MNYIFSSITNKQLEYIKLLPTAFDMMKKFDEMYLQESTALQIIQRNNLERIKLNDFSTPKNFFDEFEKAVNELKAAGANVSDQEVLNYMLKALPSEYSHIGDLIDVLPVAERTVEYLKSKINLKTMQDNRDKNKSKESPMNSSTFHTQTQFRPTCYSCGKPGHMQRECDGRDLHRDRSRGRYINCQRGRSSYRGQDYTRGRQNFRGHPRGSYRGGGNPTSRHQGYQHETQNFPNIFLTEVNQMEVNNKRDDNEIE